MPAEAGRLLFVHPLEPLEPSATYHIAVAGVTAADGRSIAPLCVSFTTKANDEPKDAASDDESWLPDGIHDWRTGQGLSPWQMLPPRTAPPGVTALAGQVLRLNGRPLAGVTLAIDGHETESDRTGRFLLLLPGVASGRHQLEIEGASASRPGSTYGFFEAGLTIRGGQTTVLPYTIWMPRLDTAHGAHSVADFDLWIFAASS